MSEEENLQPAPQPTTTYFNEELPQLRGLKVDAPVSTFTRFHRRATILQGTRTLLESQVTGFWVVLDALLRLLLGGADSRPALTATNRTHTRPHIPSGDKA